MPWEKRKGSSGRYFSYSIYCAGRVKRFYVGKAGDPVAETAAVYEHLAAIQDEVRRRERAREVEEHQLRPMTAGLDVAVNEMTRMLTDPHGPTPPLSEAERERLADDRFDPLSARFSPPIASKRLNTRPYDPICRAANARRTKGRWHPTDLPDRPAMPHRPNGGQFGSVSGSWRASTRAGGLPRLPR
jgi:hypothetical protein